MPDFRDKAEFEGCVVIRATANAVLIRGLEEEDIWIPKSQIDDDSEVWNDTTDGKGPGRLIISEWCATEKGLI